MPSSVILQQKVCPRCGFRESDFRKTLRLGCSHCYEVFAPELATFLPKLHSGCTHVGKAPRSLTSKEGRLKQELREVENLLAQGAENADALLDRWKELSLQIEAAMKAAKQLLKPTHENP